MQKRLALVILIIGAVLLTAACVGGPESDADGGSFGAGAGGGSGAVDAEAEESAAEPSVLDGVDVSALLSMKLGDVIDILGSEHSEPYSYGYDACIDYGDDCTIWYRAVTENGKPAALDFQADISGIEIFCEKDVYKGISVGQSLDEIDAGFNSRGQAIRVGSGPVYLNQAGLLSMGSWYDYNGIGISIWFDYDESKICRGIFLYQDKDTTTAVTRFLGADALDDNGEYFVLDGVDVSGLLGKRLEDVIDLLGQDHSEPYHFQGATSIDYMGSCSISYMGGIVEDQPPQIEPDAEVGTIEIFQELDVYKGISVGKTLDEINSNPDLRRKVELDTDENGEYLRDGYGMIGGWGIYAYGDSLISIAISFDDQLVCTSIFLKKYLIDPDSPVDMEKML